MTTDDQDHRMPRRRSGEVPEGWWDFIEDGVIVQPARDTSIYLVAPDVLGVSVGVGNHYDDEGGSVEIAIPLAAIEIIKRRGLICRTPRADALNRIMSTVGDASADDDDEPCDVAQAPEAMPRAWRVAIALALECGLDWARWAITTASPHVADVAPCDCVRLHVGGCFVWRDASLATWSYSADEAADAYRADCARRNVEPGPMPALEYGDRQNVTAGAIGWSANPEDPWITVGKWMVTWGEGLGWMCDGEDVDIEDMIRLGQLAAIYTKEMKR